MQKGGAYNNRASTVFSISLTQNHCRTRTYTYIHAEMSTYARTHVHTHTHLSPIPPSHALGQLVYCHTRFSKFSTLFFLIKAATQSKSQFLTSDFLGSKKGTKATSQLFVLALSNWKRTRNRLSIPITKRHSKICAIPARAVISPLQIQLQTVGRIFFGALIRKNTVITLSCSGHYYRARLRPTSLAQPLPCPYFLLTPALALPQSSPYPGKPLPRPRPCLAFLQTPDCTRLSLHNMRVARAAPAINRLKRPSGPKMPASAP